VVGIPVADEFNEYLQDIASQLRSRGVRVTVDISDDRMQKKIRNHTTAKVPFMLIAGGEDRDNNAVSFRFRDGSQENGVPVEAAVQRILEAIENKVQV
jgi:threonyl-tRNA synthetase